METVFFRFFMITTQTIILIKTIRIYDDINKTFKIYNKKKTSNYYLNET